MAIALTPQQQDRYEIYNNCQPIGLGCVGGYLYTAYDREEGRRCTIEVLPVYQDHPASTMVDEILRRIAAMECPYLLRPDYLYFDQLNGTRCMVYHKPLRETLRQRITRGSYGIESVLQWARQLALAWAALQKTSLHPCLTIDNIYLGDDENDCLLVGSLQREEDILLSSPPSLSLSSPPSLSLSSSSSAAAAALLELSIEQRQPQQDKQGKDEEGFRSYGILLYQLATRRCIGVANVRELLKEVAIGDKENEDGETSIEAFAKEIEQQYLGRASDDDKHQSMVYLVGSIISMTLHRNKVQDLNSLLSLIPADGHYYRTHTSIRERSRSTTISDEDTTRSSSTSSVPLSSSSSSSLSSNSFDGSASRALSEKSTVTGPIKSILEALTQEQNIKIRQRALAALARLGIKAAVPAVIDVLVNKLATDKDPLTRRLACLALGAMGTAVITLGGVHALIKSLGDFDASTRAAAAWGLGSMGNRVCEETGATKSLLHRSVNDSDQKVREMALQSLRRLKESPGAKRARQQHNEEEEEEEDEVTVEEVPSAKRMAVAYPKPSSSFSAMTTCKTFYAL